MSDRPLFSPTQLGQLLSHRSISPERPWCTDDEKQVDAFYRGVCDHLMRATGASARIEWDHYGSGYASFVDAWFYKPVPEFSVPNPASRGEEYFGLVVLLSRLGPYFVFMQGHKHWHGRGGSSYLPALPSVDEMPCPGVRSLALQVQPLLEGYGLQRLLRSDLSTPLAADTRVPTILGDAPYTEFDALFHWED
jgi:hypothetical protein